MSALDPLSGTRKRGGKQQRTRALTPAEQKALEAKQREQMMRRVNQFGAVGGMLGMVFTGIIVTLTYRFFFPGPGVLAPMPPKLPSLPAGSAARQPLGLAWQLHPRTGWGTYGIHIVLELLRRPDAHHFYPVLLTRPHSACFREDYPLQARLDITALWEEQAAWRKANLAEYLTEDGEFKPEFEKAPVKFSFPILHAVAGEFATSPRISGKPNIGACFFESEQLLPESVERARFFSALIAGSSWNERTLLSALAAPTATTEGGGAAAAASATTVGPTVHRVLQGVDLQLFSPPPSSASAAGAADAAAAASPASKRLSKETPMDFSALDGKFVVFSGGKLELRKGQDIVIAAFKRFRQQHPEAVLVVAWHNEWRDSVASIALSPHVLVQGAPAVTGSGGDGRLQLAPWLAANGVPAGAFVDLGRPSQSKIAAYLRRSHVALFCNRAEGGTNLVAMETVAAGVPTIISNNTGHRDIIWDDTALVLQQQESMAGRRYSGWGESSVDEAVAALEAVFADYERSSSSSAFSLRAGSPTQRRAQRAAALARSSSGSSGDKGGAFGAWSWAESVRALDAAVLAAVQAQGKKK